MILTAMMAAVAAAAVEPQTILTIDPRHRLVEGVASDGRTIWVSSILDRKILACRDTCRTLATLPKGLHPFAITWDAKRKRLWVGGDCPPNVAGITACERGALIGLDARGRVQTRIAPIAGTFHPGDVSAADGEVFVSDSQNGAVYRLLHNTRALRALVAPGVGKSGQGSALSADGKQVIVADYSQGISEIDRQGGTRKLLPRQDGKPLRGIDGLVRCGDTYFGVYNGTAPGSLLTIRMRQGGVEYGELIEGFTMPDPTQVAYDGHRLLVVADSGWATLGKTGFKRTVGAPVLAIPLGEDCRPI